MYVTTPYSMYRNSPGSLTLPPTEGPNSGCLVVDEESVTPSCFGLSKSHSIKTLPLPSNKILKFEYTGGGKEIIAIPVINQPLSANRYYLIKAHRKHGGEAYASSKKENKGVSCGWTYTKDEKPRPLDPEDKYQQFELEFINNKGLSVKSIAPDGHPPRFLRTVSEWSTASEGFIHEEATGLNSSLRASLPDFNFPLSREFSEPVCVGKWYCPFVYIYDGNMADQVKKSVYYELTLEQRWERIVLHDTSYSQGNKVMMDVAVATQVVKIGQKDAYADQEKGSDCKVVWFRTMGSTGEELSVGLSALLVERMIREQEIVGWVNGKERQVRVVREEEYGGIGWWTKFACYALVERFILKRMDGSVVLTYDFKHTHQINTKWE